MTKITLEECLQNLDNHFQEMESVLCALRILGEKATLTFAKVDNTVKKARELIEKGTKEND